MNKLDENIDNFERKRNNLKIIAENGNILFENIENVCL